MEKCSNLVYSKIFNYLSFEDLCDLRLVSKKLKKAIYHNAYIPAFNEKIFSPYDDREKMYLKNMFEHAKIEEMDYELQFMFRVCNNCNIYCCNDNHYKCPKCNNNLEENTIFANDDREYKVMEKIGLELATCGYYYCSFCSNDCVGGPGAIAKGTCTDHDCPHCQDYVVVNGSNYCDACFLDFNDIVYCYTCNIIDEFDEHDYEEHKITRDEKTILNIINSQPQKTYNINFP